MDKNTKLIRKIREFEKLNASSSINDIKYLLNQIINEYKCYTQIIYRHYCIRGRINNTDITFEKVSNLYYPPAKNVKSMVRGHRKGTSIFYISASHETATLEKRPSIGDTITIMRYKLKSLSRKPHVIELGVSETNSQYNFGGNINIIENTSFQIFW